MTDNRELLKEVENYIDYVSQPSVMIPLGTIPLLYRCKAALQIEPIVSTDPITFENTKGIRNDQLKKEIGYAINKLHLNRPDIASSKNVVCEVNTLRYVEEVLIKILTIL